MLNKNVYNLQYKKIILKIFNKVVLIKYHSIDKTQESEPKFQLLLKIPIHIHKIMITNRNSRQAVVFLFSSPVLIWSLYKRHFKTMRDRFKSKLKYK